MPYREHWMPGLGRRIRDALLNEVAAAEQRDRERSVRLPEGRRVDDRAELDTAMYQFTLPTPLHPDFRVARPTWVGPGQLVWFGLQGRQVTAELLLSDAPARLPSGSVIHPNTAAFSADLARAVEEIAALGESAWSRATSESLLEGAFGISDIPKPAAALLSGTEAPSPELNDAQVSAIVAARGSRLHYIWGPPGTGKTRSLAELIRLAFIAREPTLVLAPSHKAVHVLLEEACAATEGVLKPGEYLRWSRERDSGGRFEPLVSMPMLAQSLLPPSTDWMDAQRILLARARVVFATCHSGAVSRVLRMKRFENVVVDEASMVGPGQLFSILPHARRRLTLAGDMMQLPPVVTTSHPESRSLLELDPFRLAHVDADLYACGLPSEVSMLTTQYRMKPSVSAGVSEAFYLSLMRTDSSTERSDRDLVLVDTSGISPEARSVEGSRENIGHAGLIVDIVRGLRHKALNGSVLVATPFRRQASVIQSRLRRLKAHSSVRVGTVHSAQGQEADTVVVDVTDSWGVQPSVFVGGSDVNHIGPRLLNVAITRSRGPVVIVANVRYLELYAGSGFTGALRTIARYGRVVCARSLLKAREVVVPGS